MAQCKQTASEFIQDCFSPMVAVLCSSDAELVCMKNNLSFVELVQPFCRLTSEAFMRDPLTNANNPIKNLHVVIKEMNQFPPQPTLAKKILNESVYSSQPSMLDGTNMVTTVNGCEISYPGYTPWYEAYRSTFLQISYPSDHEFTKTFIACVFVVSSNHVDPLDQINKLNKQQHQQQHQSPSKLPKWFTPNIFKYYVLVHDFSTGDMSKAETIYQSMKYQYGAHACHLLQINSCIQDESPSVSDDNIKLNDKNTNLMKPDPWSQFLNKKPVKSDTFDSGPRTPLEDSGNQIFPGHVTEGSIDSETKFSPEEAIEVTEQTMSYGNVVNHPLAATQNHVTQPNTYKKSKTESVAEKDSPLGNNYSDNANGIPAKWPMNQDTLDLTSSNQVVQHGCCLSASDIDRVKIFIHEFCVRGLFPYAEKLIRTLNEQVSNRKGLHKSLFSATKKWFGGNKSGVQSPSVPFNSVIYGQEALELQVRRLGDLAFMFQNYELAYQAYHTAKRDFNNDQAWFYYAGALEMAALAVFMQGSSSQKPYPHHYLENAISTYSSCKSSEFATRATMLSTECLKSRNQFSDSAMQYIRMTSEDSDLCSALLLEQAAYCFLAINKPVAMARKYAFHMILAGHRFSKAGQRKHSLRCYKQAYQVYKDKGWTLAEDHINFTVGRQSLNLKELQKACGAFKVLLADGSKQSAAQQAAYLREFLFVHKELSGQISPNEMEDLQSLPVPKIVSQNIKVMVTVTGGAENEEETVSFASGVSFCDPEGDNNIWNKLETVSSKRSSKKSVMLHNLPCFSSKTVNSHKPQVIVNESVIFEIELINVLKVPLILSDIFLLWKYHHIDSDGRKSETCITNSNIKNQVTSAEGVIETEHISELNLEGLQTEKVHLRLKPLQTGEIEVLGMSYKLAMLPTLPTTNDVSSDLSISQNIISNTADNLTVNGQQTFHIRGPRLNNTKKEKCGCYYGPDERLKLKINDAMPQLQVKFYGAPSSMLSGEIKQMLVEFTNIGPKTLHKLYVSSDFPEMFCFGHANMHLQMDYGVFKASPIPTPRKYSNKHDKLSSVQPIYVDDDADVDRVCQIPLGNDTDTLEPNQSVQVPLWLWAPHNAGQYNLKLLFLYHLANSKPSRYRTLRHQFKFCVSNSIELEAMATRSGSTCLPDQVENKVQRNSNSLHVSLEITNSNEVSDPNIAEITIVQISSVSPRWSLMPLSSSYRQGVKINPGEKAHISLKSIPFKMDDLGEGSCNSVVLAFSNIPLTDCEIDSSSSPCSDFYHRSKVKLDDLMKEEPPPAALIPEVLPPSPKSLDIEAIKSALVVDLTIIILWKAFIVDEKGMSHLIMGQHLVTIDKINSSICSRLLNKIEEETAVLKLAVNSDEDEKAEEGQAISTAVNQLLKHSLVHPHQVTHNFLKNRMCIVPVTVIFQSCCDVSLIIKLLTSSSRNQASLSNIFPESNLFTWIGCHNSTFEMSPGERKEISISACFVATGTYNLSTLQIKVKPVHLNSELVMPGDDGYVVQKSLHSSVIAISQ